MQTSQHSNRPTPQGSEVQLARPLRLFGSTLKVSRSTAVTFSPDTVLRAVFGISMVGAIRRERPDLFLEFRKLSYVLKRKHLPSQTTKKLLLNRLGAAYADGTLLKAMEGVAFQVDRGSEWSAILSALGTEPTTFTDIVTCMAACDEHLLQVVGPLYRAGQTDEAECHLQELFGEGLAAWSAALPGIQREVAMLADVALQGLVWVELRHPPPPRGRSAVSVIDCLLAPGKRPIGHWLAEICHATDSQNLAALSTRLAELTQRHERPIEHELLRKWSSCRHRLMPPLAATTITRAFVRLNPAHEPRFFVARFLTFIIELAYASVSCGRPDWVVVQAHVRRRLEKLYVRQLQQGCAKA